MEAGGVVQVVDRLLASARSLNSNIGTTKKKKKNGVWEVIIFF
jgi:hypothetical protein